MSVVPQVAVVVGNPKPGSRTLASAVHVARAVAGCEVHDAWLVTARPVLRSVLAPLLLEGVG